VFENERILAIVDLHPVAPVHILIMPKKPIKNLQSLEPEDTALIGEIVLVAQQIAEEKGIADGYRLLTNNGPDAGQVIFHLHFHLIGGAVLGPMA
jgi:histidine triad (HIT) family protein